MTDHAIRFDQLGGPEVLRYETVDVPGPGEGEVRLRQTAIGVNLIDTYYRSGLYSTTLPSGLGVEAAGTVEAVGPGVSELAAGDRVAYCLGTLGGYATARTYPAARLVRLPADVGDEAAAAALLKGLTAWYLIRRLRPLRPGETILVHAAAGGVGTILTQWAHHLGARVIGVVGSSAKAEIARAFGADEVILSGHEEVPARVRAMTDGRGVPVVYDSVGRDTFEASLDSLARFGLLVSFGNASGPAPAVTPLTLMARGSVFLTRPLLNHYIEERADLEAGARELFELIASGAIRPLIGQRVPLAEAAAAHAMLERRATSGATILLP